MSLYFKCFICSLSFLLSISALNTFSYAQTRLLWEYRYDGPNKMQDVPQAVGTDNEGNVFVAGITEMNRNPVTSFDYLLLKFNKAGNPEWSRNFNGLGQRSDELSCFYVNDSGYTYLSGFSGTGISSESEIATIKYNPNGLITWLDFFKDANSSYENGIPVGMSVDKKGNLYLGANIYKEAGSEFVILKYSSDGKMRGSVPDTTGIYYSYGNHFYFSGSEFIYVFSARKDSSKYKLVMSKYDTSLAILWSKTFSFPQYDSVSYYSTCQDSNDNFYVIAGNRSMTKIDSSGEVLFHRNIFEKDKDTYTILNFRADKYGNIYFSGEKNSPLVTETFLARYNVYGEFKWEKYIAAGDSGTRGRQFDFDNDGNIYLLSYKPAEAARDIIITKFDPSGNITWENIYDFENLNKYHEEPRALKVTGNDEFILAAGCWTSTTAYDVITAKFIPSTSSLEETEYYPKKNRLEQNYPNPFNPVTTINFQLASGGYTELKIIDILGREVSTLLSRNMAAGNHSVEFDASAFASGIYIYRLQSGSYLEVKKMVVQK